MLISYNINNGMLTTIWLTTSGGVTIAAIIKMITMAYFLYFLKNVGVTKPNFERKNITIGNSKTSPQDSVVLLMSEI